MQDIGDFPGLTIYQMLNKVSRTLGKAIAGSKANPVDLDDVDAMDLDGVDQDFGSSEEEDEDVEIDSDDDWETGLPKQQHQASSKSINREFKDRATMLALNTRIRQDLRAAKQAGFRLSHLGQLLNNGDDSFVAVSCRISKFGISKEALQAWHLDPRLYFTMVIRYTAGYCSLARLMSEESSSNANGMHIRVGLTQRYKITLAEAIDAFSEKVDKSRGLNTAAEEVEAAGHGLAPFFISRPMNELLRDRLVVLLKYRTKYAFSWIGAEGFYNDSQGMSTTASDDLNAKYWQKEESRNASLPSIVTMDHFGDIQNSRCTTDEGASFPLTAMQFALRHLVRCTEFCLVCHCKVDADFEALKPYVCSKPLCLYQYMALGFGPSIEHEIMTQPQVVDLLVSFCYSSALTHNALKVFPDGMGLTVPPASWFSGYAMNQSRYSSLQPNPAEVPQATSVPEAVYKARLDGNKNELIFAPGDKIPALRTGTWICLSNPKSSDGPKIHCRIVEILFPTVRLGHAIIAPSKGPPEEKNATAQVKTQVTSKAQDTVLTTAATLSPNATGLQTLTKFPEVTFVIYDQNFDDLDANSKSKTIRILLDTLPTIDRLKEYLETGRHSSLNAWADRLSPAALGVLRWIIASNRSCIIQVDQPDGSTKSSEERVSGMPDYVQFRFAQGAPDKEQRFIESVRENIDNAQKNVDHPTLFAWHGGSIYNWHSIMREGLHFKEVVNGRAFGNGVYFSPYASTSLGYSGATRYPGGSDGSISPWMWPHSQLRISDALSLNEIVNRPDKFVSTSPHLVVAQLDWIQTRYLFVRCNFPRDDFKEVLPSDVYAQDPKYTATGASNTPISIPITAVSKSRRPSTAKFSKNGAKKARISDDEEVTYVSDDTDIEDLEIFFEDKEEQPLPKEANGSATNGKSKDVAIPGKADPTKTDFVPGSLDHSTLPILDPPAYATSMGTRTLQKELQATLKIQDATPAHELGWYIDRELITNVYQWIVELHSFEAHLPLAKDMKSRNLKSIVLELRFGATYPMSPPFVRVIRPRFLSFMAGGGGHVTAGGALCMELLTNSGWSVASNIESVLVQVRAAISSTDPKPARLENGPVGDYGTGEAVEAYIRACNTHGMLHSLLSLHGIGFLGVR